MAALTLEGHLGRSVAIDLCPNCQAFWFDRYESLQLSAASVLELFKLIARAGPVKAALSRDATCPLCQRKLHAVKDLQRRTRFEYRDCLNHHGRLISFFNFLREKDFIRPLSPAQVDELRRNVHMVNCSNCGAPIDLAAGTACGHCGSPLSMLDVGQAEALVAALRAAGRGPHAPDRALPLDLERARRDVNRAFESFQHAPGWYTNVAEDGLVHAAIDAFSTWLSTDL